MITKILFQTSKKPPKKYIVDLIKNKLTDEWNYIHFDDLQIIDFIKNHPIEGLENILNKLENVSGPHKADLFRYYFLYLKGGFFMDSDAMIYVNIENVTEDFEFVSVDSSCHPGSIFQGIIGASPGNKIIKEALFKAYETSLESLQVDYHFFCKELFNIVKSDTKNRIRLLNECRRNSKGDLIIDDQNNILFKHFWRRKKIKLRYSEYIFLLKFYLHKIRFNII